MFSAPGGSPGARKIVLFCLLRKASILAWSGRRLPLFVQGLLPMRTLGCALSLARRIPSRVDDGRRAWRNTLLCLVGRLRHPDLNLGSFVRLLGRGPFLYLFFWSAAPAPVWHRIPRAPHRSTWDSASPGAVCVRGPSHLVRALCSPLGTASQPGPYSQLLWRPIYSPRAPFHLYVQSPNVHPPVAPGKHQVSHTKTGG